MTRVPIERRERLSADGFYQEFLAGAGRPVIVTDAMGGWKARSKWGLEFFKTRYGSDTVTVGTGASSRFVKVMKLAEYMDYIDSPSEKSPGFWMDQDKGLPLKQPPEPTTSPLYLSGWNPFRQHPELLEDVEPTPYFVDDWIPLLPPELRQLLQETHFRPCWILIGPKGSISRLHYDFFHTHAYLAQIIGRKKCILFSPKDSEILYNGQVDPERPD